eukprot:9790048-Karenia_brevis.AAC.1
MGVVDYLVEGVRVVGNLPRIGIWKQEDKRAVCSEKVLWAGAKQAQEKLMEHRRVTKIDVEVWEKTMEEVGDELLVGPLGLDEVKAKLGSLWVGARRFGLRQGDKTRPIDDFSEFLINMAFGSNEKISMLGLDQVVEWSRAWQDAAKEGGVLRTLDEVGRAEESKVDKGWGENGFVELVGRVTDLKAAYKQLPLHPAN